MKACLLAIGDEIISGITTDTNSGFLAQLLREVGVEVTGVLTVPDDEAAIATALRRATKDAELVISTGGLGPTADDLTTTCVAAFAGLPLDLHEPSLAQIAARFRDRGLEMPPNNRKQALLPRGCTLIPNPEGTAPGFICEVASTPARFTASLPGVPREMKRMAEETLLPWIARRSGAGVIRSTVFSTVGLSESKLDQLLVGAVQPDEARLSFRAAFPRLQTRVTVSGDSADEVEERLRRLEGTIRARLGDHLYATGDVGLEETVGELLRANRLTLSVAESCTGGLIGHRITDVAGSSEYFLNGVVAYSNEAKQRLLGVSSATIEEHGAVSEQTVLEMARGVRKIQGSSLGLSTSGIAGPGGGTPEKPVGTLCVGIAWEGGEWSRRFDLGKGSRTWIKQMSAQVALDALRRRVLALTDATTK